MKPDNPIGIASFDCLEAITVFGCQFPRNFWKMRMILTPSSSEGYLFYMEVFEDGKTFIYIRVGNGGASR